MRTAVVTGAASGIGRATRQHLERDRWRVIGVDLHGTEIIADLSTASGRAVMLEEVERDCGGALGGVVACAGVSGRTNPGDLVLRLNYFGAVATLEGLRPLLAADGGGGAVAISSNAAFTVATIDEETVQLCLRGEEDAAVAHLLPDSVAAYATAKLALARWVRHRSVTAEWVGAGLRLNAVAPGLIVTAMTAGQLESIRARTGYPRPTEEPGRPEEVASLIAYLLSPEARYIVGSVVVIDGGTDAAVRPDL